MERFVQSQGAGRPSQSRKRNKKTRTAAELALARKATSRSWHTTDEEEIEKRRARAVVEQMDVRNLDSSERFYATFAVVSGASGAPYRVEIRSLVSRENSCSCPDFQVNGLGTCKHIEAVLHRLRTSWPRAFRQATASGSPRVEIFLHRTGGVEVAISVPAGACEDLGQFAGRFFDSSGRLLGRPEDSVPAISRAIEALDLSLRRRIRLAREVTEWASALARARARAEARNAFLEDVKSGRRTMNVVSQPLYPYQQDGMLHLAFGERVMLVDEMGLGKTVQAIAATALLRELRGIERVLVVSPASLKTEWEEQIRKFTDLPLQLLSGPRRMRHAAYRQPAFFNLVNYEQVLKDVAEINALLAPDVVILDEAQRIKNWSAKTAQAVKRLASPFAFVLTGTPLENRIDEIYSITEFLDPNVFGPLFRFNREFYILDEKGRPAGYKNLEELRRRVRPLMLRRRKDEVEEQLPQRVDNNYFVEMSAEQRAMYSEFEEKVAKLVAVASRRPLTMEESERLQKWLACMRMLCDTTYILDRTSRICPKLGELEHVIEEAGLLNGRKALIFSEWERMLELVRDLAGQMKLGYAWHTGSVPQLRRREEINRFKQDPGCKLFISTDSGGVGLNLQAASVVINLDLPWNPARLEQRIARAWRKHQTQAVNVVNLVTSNSIEHRMLSTLAVKRELADGIIDGRGDLATLKMPSGREAFLNRLKLIMGAGIPVEAAKPSEKERIAVETAADPAERFRQALLAELSSRVQLIRASRAPKEAKEAATLVVVDGGSDQLRPVIERMHREAGQGGAIEVLDKQTYEMIEQLVRRGVIAWPGEAEKELHRSPALKRQEPSRAELALKKAEAMMEQSRRKAKMADVLTAGGFCAEAVAAAREAVEIAIKALICLARQETEDAQEEPAADVAASLIHSELVGKGFITAEHALHVSALREFSAAKDIEDDTAKRLLGPGLGLVETASAALARAALGAAPQPSTSGIGTNVSDHRNL